MQKYLILLLSVTVLACGKSRREIKVEKLYNKEAAFIKQHNVDIDLDTLELNYTIDIQDLILPKRIAFSPDLRDVERLNDGILYTFQIYSNSNIVLKLYDDKNLIKNYDMLGRWRKAIATISKVNKVKLSLESDYEIVYDGLDAWLDSDILSLTVPDLFVFQGKLVDFEYIDVDYVK